MNSNIKEIDVHNMKRLEAKEYIYDEIKKCRKFGIYTIHVVHGFNNGTVIKDWLNSSEEIKEICNVSRVENDVLNPGATYIYLNIKK